MGLLLQLTADQTGLQVIRPVSVETTALGAATLAGLAEGVWGSLGDLAELGTEDQAFTPEGAPPATEVEAVEQPGPGRRAVAAGRATGRKD